MLATLVKMPSILPLFFLYIKLRRGRKTLILHTLLSSSLNTKTPTSDWTKLLFLFLFQDTRRLSFSTVLFFLLGCTGVYLISQARVPLSWKMYYRRQRRIVSLRSLGTLFTLVCLVWLPGWGWSCWQHILIGLISTTHIYIIHSKYFSNSILIGLNLMANSS